jgi:hypothetical protein
MKRIVKLTESDLNRIVKRVIKESEEKNYFNVFDKDGDLVWMGITTKGSEEEKELIDKLHDRGYSMKRSNKYEFENFDPIKNVIPYIRKKFRGMKRENFERGSANWYNKEGEEVLQYHNRFFLVSEDIFIDVMEKFGLDSRETKRVFSKYFDSKFPSLRHMGVEPN